MGRGSRQVRLGLFAVGALTLGACSSASSASSPKCSPSRFRHSPPLVIAHAGGEGLGPANTILAMQRSLAAGADVLDADLWMTRDGVVVAHHDRDLSSATGSTAKIDELTWTQLEQLDTRPGWTGAPIDAPVRIPSLQQILDAFPTQEISLEIKQTSPSMAAPLCDVLTRSHAVGRVYLSANNDDDVYAAQTACPQSTVITTTDKDVAAMRIARGDAQSSWCAPAPIGQPPYNVGRLQGPDVTWSHDHGMAIYTWTVDDPATLRTLAEAGVDGVYTRRPDIARKVFDEVAVAASGA